MSKRPYLDKSYPAVDPNGDAAPFELDANGNLKTTATISGDVVVDAVTIDNDAAHPVPVTSEQLGEVQASPTANTVLDRLKTLASLIGEVQASPTSNTLLDRVKGLATLLAGGLPAALTSGGGVKTGLVDALPAGTNTIGTARNAMGYVESTPSLDTNIYASGDVLFVPTAIAFASANGGRGLLHSITIIDKDDQGQALDLVFLRDTTTTFGTINGAVGIDDTDAGQILGIVSISSSDFIDLGGCKIATLPNIGLTLRAASGGTGCYVAGISRGTGTYNTGTGLIIKLGIAALD